MRRFVLTVTATTFATLVLLGGIGFLAFRGFIDARVAEATGLAAPFAADLPAEIRDLHNLPPEQRFDHFMGAQFSFSDTNDKQHRVSITSGTVSAIKSDELTLNLNEGGNRTYTLNSETRIHTAGQRWSGGQSANATPKAGDKVVVVTLDNSTTAKAVMIGGPDGFRPHGGPPWHRN